VSTRGLTLIEVLVAVVLCGAGLSVVAGGVAAAVRAEAYAADLTRAADHVDLVLARLESQELSLETASGDFSEDGEDDLTWEVEVDTPQDVQTEGLNEVTVTVRWSRYEQERDLSVVRWVFLDPLQGGVR
jgi:prepilin-type N-terminal cleavage/methylation domain-containing protein